MKLSQVVFVEAVKDIVADRSVTSFVAAESPTRADGYGYEIEAIDGGVVASHPKRPNVRRLIPWPNVRWADMAEELETADTLPPPPEAPKRRGRPPKKREESSEVPNAVQE